MTEERENLLSPSSLVSYAIQPDDSGKVFTGRISDIRLTTVTYSVVVSLIGTLLFGYAIGYSSPVINQLEDEDKPEHGYLSRKEYQGVFSVRFNSCMSRIKCCCHKNCMLY